MRDTHAADALVEQRRIALETATGRSTWDPPLAEFENAVVDNTIASVCLHFTEHGIFVTDSYGDFHTTVMWEDIIDETVDLWNGSGEFEAERHLMIAALREAAAKIELSTKERAG